MGLRRKKTIYGWAPISPRAVTPLQPIHPTDTDPMASAAKKKDAARPPAGPKAPSRRRRMLGMGVVLLGVAGWMFFLGILVGRGTAPVRFDIDRLEQELAAMRQALAEKERQLSAAVQTPDSELDFSFFDDLKQSEEHATVTFKAPPPDPDVPPLSAAPDSEAAPPLAGPAPVETETATTAQSAEPTPAKTKKSLKKATFKGVASAPRPAAPTTKPGQAPGTSQAETTRKSRGRLTIQVAAVQDASTANAMVAKLKQQGYSAHQSLARIPGKGLRYRIRVGHFGTAKDAQAMVIRLKKDQYDTMLVNR